MTQNIWPTCRFLWRTLVHKRYVFQAGLRTKAPLWRLLIHDWTKFTPSEAPHYGRQQFGSANDSLGFAYAWNHHQRLNSHHWQAWIPITAHHLSEIEGGKPLPMPEWAVREMVADWIGATRGYEGRWPSTLENWAWLQRSRPEMLLHSKTEAVIDRVLAEYFANPIQ